MLYSHVQLNEQGEFLRFIHAGELIEWDANNYCTAFALEKDGNADQFRIKPFYTAAQPTFDAITEAVKEVDPVPVDGLWTQQWEVFDLDADALAANQAAQAAARKAVILAELATIDTKSIRALCEQDTDRLAALEAQKVALRNELRAM